MTLLLDCSPISIDDVVRVARERRRVRIGTEALAKMAESRSVIEQIVATGQVVYGVSTGFGKFADRVIPVESLEHLQRNLILSHSVGVGEELGEDVVRAMMVLRIAALCRGYSGIRPRTVETLAALLNENIVPVIPSRGSVGASGDLAPLAHLGLALIGEGDVRVGGELVPAAVALARHGIEAVVLTAKEGLALINGTQLMTAIGSLLVADARRLLATADVVGALSLEAVRGSNRPFDPRIQNVRPHPGQLAAANHLRDLTAGSPLMASHRDDAHKVQDPYSLRCMPQVHGASRDAINYCRSVIEIEANSATDNPLVFADEHDVISGGNFHGQPVAMALDFAAIALAEIGSISERRTEAMLDPHFSELPPFLTMHGGVDSGYMVAQYTAAALASENKVLAHPASVDSIPTSANQEDHVSMGVTAAHKAVSILRNVETILAIELLCACEGLEYRRPWLTTPALECVYATVRETIAHLDEDRALYRDIEAATELVRSGSIERAADGVLAG